MKRLATYISVLFCVYLLPFVPRAHASAAGDITAGLSSTASASGYGATPIGLDVFIGNVISAILGATGIIFVIIAVYAGILYMTASGETEKVKKAKSMLIQAAIGLIIIVGAYALTSFVVKALNAAATTP